MSDERRKLHDAVHKRNEILDILVDDPKTKAELIDICSKSRSTVDRGLELLQEVECVEYGDGKYHTTPKGEIALTAYSRYTDTINNIQKSGRLLNTFPNENSLNSRFIHEMDVHQADPKIPDLALEPIREILRESTRLLGLVPTVHLSYTRVIEDAINQSETSVELIIEDHLFSTLQNTNAYEFDRILDNDRTSIQIYNGALPYSLWIMTSENDTYAGIIVHKDGGIKGVLINNTSEAISWTRNVYEHYKNEATIEQ
ncbi:helix-turn-helix transcriptional regulator [Natrinema salaciae]|uniref:Predicted transcriptional regulator, contains HTH domain n=1 Tax=Natrinema salaciae TaxID=1186196 RepID=A0A1H9IC37_9EURY|nr:hypothetical protein [Natrinema salaciae]SEQ72153.1 Predicted transcriptional regulator, contains HTH domain [Natrinema salaciae]